MEFGDKRSIRDSYNTLGGRLYDNRYWLEQTAKYDVILSHVEPSAEDILLDDGCGTGLFIEMLQNFTVGVDLSQSLLFTARLRLGNAQRAHLIQADSDHLPLKRRVFDKVFAVTLIQNTPEPEKALREIERVSRATSDIVVTVLKKALALHEFKRLLNISGLEERYLILDDELKDWFAFANLRK